MNCTTAFGRTWLEFLLLLACAGMLAEPCRAQGPVSPKFVAFAGAGTMVTPAHAVGGMQFGASLEESVPNKWMGFGVEGGYVGSWSRLRAGSGIFSVNYIPPWRLDKKARFLPFATVGYTRMVATGNALNYGAGLDYRLNNAHAIRFEVRDCYNPTRPVQHNPAFRIGWVAYVAD